MQLYGPVCDWLPYIDRDDADHSKLFLAFIVKIHDTRFLGKVTLAAINEFLKNFYNLCRHNVCNNGVPKYFRGAQYM